MNEKENDAKKMKKNDQRDRGVRRDTLKFAIHFVFMHSVHHEYSSVASSMCVYVCVCAWLCVDVCMCLDVVCKTVSIAHTHTHKEETCR